VREERLASLRSSSLRVLVATDVAARGLDVVGLEAMVNYELPRSTADYTHRVGRTGRAGVAGVAVSFVATTGAGNQAHWELIERRHGGMRVPPEVLPGFEPKDIDRVFGGTAREAGEQVAGGEARAGGEVELVTMPGVRHSKMGLAHDRMHGGVKGRRLSKKDKLRAAHVAAARKQLP
jgi:ATP-dependent RNA helicase RhlE